MDVEPIESVASSAVFGGLNQSVSVYEDRVIVRNPDPPILKTKEARYEQIDDVHLYTGVLYATLTLGIRNDYRVMVRWLPRGKATRVADLIRERMGAA
jgi:PH (Pleckstrin Homology) domain-containing protein